MTDNSSPVTVDFILPLSSVVPSVYAKIIGWGDPRIVLAPTLATFSLEDIHSISSVALSTPLLKAIKLLDSFSYISTVGVCNIIAGRLTVTIQTSDISGRVLLVARISAVP